MIFSLFSPNKISVSFSRMHFILSIEYRNSTLECTRVMHGWKHTLYFISSFYNTLNYVVQQMQQFSLAFMSHRSTCFIPTLSTPFLLKILEFSHLLLNCWKRQHYNVLFFHLYFFEKSIQLILLLPDIL